MRVLVRMDLASISLILQLQFILIQRLKVELKDPISQQHCLINVEDINLGTLRVQMQLFTRSFISLVIDLVFHLLVSIQHIILEFTISAIISIRPFHKDPLFGLIEHLLLFLHILLELLSIKQISLDLFIRSLQFLANRTPFPKDTFVIEIEFMAFFALDL